MTTSSCQPLEISAMQTFWSNLPNFLVIRCVYLPTDVPLKFVIPSRPELRLRGEGVRGICSSGVFRSLLESRSQKLRSES
jgi:hypothetical protein